MGSPAKRENFRPPRSETKIQILKWLLFSDEKTAFGGGESA